MRRKLAAGNWKMNGTAADLAEIEALIDQTTGTSVEVLICPPATLLHRMSLLTADSAVKTGGQDCHATQSGAHTGDIAVGMLVDAGASAVIVGHSERRTNHAETDQIVRAKAQAAIGAGLIAIVCIGETEAERDAAQTLDVISTQLAGSIPDAVTDDTLVIAYEPVWAIGTGKVPTLDQIAEAHGAIRSHLRARFGQDVGDGIRLLYGGSVKAANASEIFAVADVDGALVGGASLKASDFKGIIAALAVT
jgi:triosephosphate isomerase